MNQWCGCTGIRSISGRQRVRILSGPKLLICARSTSEVGWWNTGNYVGGDEHFVHFFQSVPAGIRTQGDFASNSRKASFSIRERCIVSNRERYKISNQERCTISNWERRWLPRFRHRLTFKNDLSSRPFLTRKRYRLEFVLESLCLLGISAMQVMQLDRVYYLQHSTCFCFQVRD